MSSHASSSAHASGADAKSSDGIMGPDIDASVRSSASRNVSVDYIQQLWMARIVSRTLMAPVDRVKYLMQSQRELVRLGTLRHGWETSLGCARHIARVEGTKAFWRGNIIQVISLLPIALAQYFIALPTQNFIFESWPASGPVGYTIASYTALLGGGLAAAAISYPLDFARFRLAVDVKSYKGQPYAFRHSLGFYSMRVLNECPHYLYTGLTLYVLGSFVYQSVHGALLNLVGPYVPPERADSGWTPILVQTFCGLTISSLATLALHPVDLVRHRMMIAVTDDVYRYRSAMQCVLQIAQKEGLRGYYRGGMITLTRMVLATGLAMIGLPY